MESKNYTYRLKFKGQNPMLPAIFSSDNAANIGDVIKLDAECFHCVIRINNLDSFDQLVLSDAYQSEGEALILAAGKARLQLP